MRRPDEFTAAPDFIDPHDSDHMPMGGRLAASWHGMAPQRLVLAAAGLLVVAGAFVALAIFTAQDLGSAPGSQAPLGAHDGGGSPLTTPLPSSVPGNATSSPPLPTPLPIPSLPPPGTT